MQVQNPSTPPTAGLKRVRMQQFPGAFEEQLLRLITERSALLRDQLECMGESAMSGRLQLPEGIGALWLDCISTPPPHLKNGNNDTIAAYLKVCACCIMGLCCAPALGFCRSLQSRTCFW